MKEKKKFILLSQDHLFNKKGGDQEKKKGIFGAQKNLF